ncbi:large subunit GTPase 1 homolog [Acanthaster planci]|uniref:Large subunit GTPase 1 homolog n=1 Tax=Acanthaster planci TaxID=133434 RepID=A0A8B7ZLL0_ACAPL|nr:large subunit GTPase 1 homolog [Acanthaster planci]XP_022104221.1 large subunit GTPase 1 homolog [Acanthaster planci]
MGKKKNRNVLGKSIIRDRFKTSNQHRDADASWLHTSELNDGYDWGRLNLNSVTEQSHLDDFLLTAELAGTEFTAERQNIRVVDPNDSGLPSAEETKAILEAQELNKDLLCIPRRPKWDAGTTKEQLAQRERESFLEWRRQLALLQEKEHVVMTPFERNLEFWRQLWRVIERSDIIVQIVDARNPLLFRCEDLEKYVKEVGSTKENMVLISKADLLTPQQRQQWADYFSQQGLKVAFWSAVLETERIKLEAAEENQGDGDEDEEERSSESDQDTADEEDGDDDVSFQPPRLGPDPDVSQLSTHPDTPLNREAPPTSSVTTTESADVGERTGHHHETQNTSNSETNSPDCPQTDQNLHELVDSVSSRAVRFASHDTGDNAEVSTESANRRQESDAENGCGPEGEEGRERKGRGQVVNDSKLLTGEELVQFFYHLHSGPKVQEGVTTVGMVGYPNVGKSSTINALLQQKKVPVSATPGRTKHFQTLYVEPTMCLCDCPGLVMPSMVSSKAEMIVSGILCIDHLRDSIPPVSLVCERIPRHILNNIYGINIIKPRGGEDANRTPTAREFLNAYAYMRGFMTNHGIPDCPRAARVILKDYVKGKLLYCHPPPGMDAVEFQDFDRMDTSRGGGDATKTQREASGPVITEEGTKLKKQPTSCKLDETFFAPKTVVSHVKGPIGPRGGTSGIKGQGSAQGLADKPWKKHGNRNKREKLRRVYGHHDD